MVMTRIKIFVFVLGMLNASLGSAQLAPQIFAGHRGAEYNFLWFKGVDAKGRISLFNFTSFFADYEEQTNNLYEIYQVGIYNLNPSWGLAGGGRFVGGEFVPLIAVSYQKVIRDLYFNLFPSAQYVPSAQQINYSLFGLLFYTPRINDTWKVFSQLTFEPLFNLEKHIYSYQQIRLGLEFKEQFQFGIGVNLDQVGKDFTFRQNYGLFIRKEFE